jgi:hypothetical protein
MFAAVVKLAIVTVTDLPPFLKSPGVKVSIVGRSTYLIYCGRVDVFFYGAGGGEGAGAAVHRTRPNVAL